MKSLAELIQKYPKVIFFSILALTVFFAYYALQVEMTTDIKAFFPEGHPKVVTYDEITEKFGGAEYIMVALEATDVFTHQVLTRIDTLTRNLEQIPGVKNVQSLANMDDIKGSEWGIEAAPLIEEIPSDPAALNDLKQKVLSDEMYSGMLVSEDATVALTTIEVDPNSDAVEVALAVHELIADSDGVGNLYLTGTPYLNAILADSMKGDLVKLFPIVMLLVAFILFLYFRSIRGVVLPFITVLVSVVWTLGLMGLLNKNLSPLNATMPVILVSLGNAYGIYLLARYYDEVRMGVSREAAVKNTLTSVGIAVLLAGTTTVAGFAANVSSSITLMKDFGLFTAYGVLVALGISLIFIPAMLTLLPLPKKRNISDNNDADDGFLAGILKKLAGVVAGNSKKVVLVTMVLVFVAVIGIPRISTDSNFFNFFDDGTEPRIAYELVKDKLSGSESIEIVIKGDILSPQVLRAMKGVQVDLEETGLVGTTMSVVNVLEKANMALNDGDPAFLTVPDSRELVAQYLLLLEMSGDGLLDRFLTMDYQEARIQGLVKDSSSAGTAALFGLVDRLFDVHFGSLDIEATQTGIIALLDTLASMIIDGQIKSLVFSLVTVFVIVRLLLRSWEGSFLSTLLIFLTTLANFGLMGWIGIPLDIVTVLISSIGVGVGIDYSIHIYSRYQEEQGKGASEREAMVISIMTTGKAIVTNAGAVVAGFLILLLSSFPPFRYFGSLVTATMIVAALGALTLLPALVILRAEVQGRRRDKGMAVS